MNQETVFTELLINTNHALANDEAAIKDMVRMISNYVEKGKRPFYMYCSATGLKVGMSQTPVFQKRIEKFNGDLVQMFLHYKSRGARKESVAVEVPVAKEDAEVVVFVEPEAEVVVPTENEVEAAKREERNRRRREQRAAKKQELIAA